MWTTAPPPPGPPRPPSGGTKIPWLPIGVAAAVFVLVLGSLGIWFLVKPDDSSSGIASTSETPTTETTDRTTKRPPRTTPSQGPDSFDTQLMGVLPRGYDANLCRPVHPPATGALATVDCGPAPQEGGPTSARLSLFADQQALDNAFDGTIALYAPMLRCPASELDSPTTWHYTDTPDAVAGRIACGTYQDKPGVTWTKNDDLLLGDTMGENLEALHGWWLNFA